MSLEPNALRDIVVSVKDEDTGLPILCSNNIKALQIDGTKVQVVGVLGYAAQSQWPQWEAQIVRALQEQPGVEHAECVFEQKIVAHATQNSVARLPGIKNIIAVASGKGGVGKSTVAVNIALALAAEGAKVGLLDADIYGPSQPTMLGLTGRPALQADQKMVPLEKYGIQVNSIGFLIDSDSPVIWRGPMVTSALMQLLQQSVWHALDYLIIDLPPGTGDVQLTLAQRVPVAGGVIVTTPQDIALLDAKKGLRMFEKVGVTVLGLVENMSMHVCTQCGHAESIFGAGGGEKMAQQYGVPLLGQLPLDGHIRAHSDKGCPTVIAEPQGACAQKYHAIARKLARELAQKPRDMRASFPKVVTQPATKSS